MIFTTSGIIIYKNYVCIKLKGGPGGGSRRPRQGNYEEIEMSEDRVHSVSWISLLFSLRTFDRELS